jgi:hypothetical protein
MFKVWLHPLRFKFHEATQPSTHTQSICQERMLALLMKNQFSIKNNLRELKKMSYISYVKMHLLCIEIESLKITTLIDIVSRVIIITAIDEVLNLLINNILPIHLKTNLHYTYFLF